MQLMGRLKRSPLVRSIYRNVFVTGDTVRLVVQQPIIRRMLPERVECALDAGCGSGEYTRSLLIPRAERVLAADLREAPVRRMAERLSDVERGNCLPAAATVTHLPCRDGSVDLILCSEVLEHCEDDAAVVREFQRVLKPGGTLVLTVPVPPAPYADDSHVREGYTLAQLTELLGEAGLSVEEHEYCLFRLSRAALKLRVGWTARFPLPFMFIVHLERLFMGGAGESALPFDIVLRAVKH